MTDLDAANSVTVKRIGGRARGCLACALLLLVLMASCCTLRQWNAWEREEASAPFEGSSGGRIYWVPDYDPWSFVTGSNGIPVHANLRSTTDADLMHLDHPALRRVQAICFIEPRFTDAGLEHLERLVHLRELSLDSAQITDAGLEHLKSLSALRKLDLNGTKVTDAGLKALSGLNWLSELGLNETKITGVGMADLAGLPDLSTVYVGKSPITDAGLKSISGFPVLANLILDETCITDSGLRHLANCKYLETLYLRDTQVSDAGLEHLKGLNRLHWLDLSGTRVTKEGVNKLQEALPHCSIDTSLPGVPRGSGRRLDGPYRPPRTCGQPTNYAVDTHELDFGGRKTASAPG